MCAMRALCGRKLRGAAKLLVLSILLSSLLLGAPSTSYSQKSEPAEKPTIQLTPSELDSIVTHIEILEIDLDEARQLARIDSIYAAERLRIQREMYEAQLRAATPPWYEKLLKHPVVWVTIGMWVGVQASR